MVAHLGEHIDTLPLVVPCLLVELGTRAVFSPLYRLILAAVDNHEIGSASGSLPAVQQLAAALGVAALTTRWLTSGPTAAINRVQKAKSGKGGQPCGPK